MDWLSITYWSGFLINIIILIKILLKGKETIFTKNCLIFLVFSWFAWLLYIIFILEDNEKNNTFLVILLAFMSFYILLLLQN